MAVLIHSRKIRTVTFADELGFVTSQLIKPVEVFVAFVSTACAVMILRYLDAVGECDLCKWIRHGSRCAPIKNNLTHY